MEKVEFFTKGEGGKIVIEIPDNMNGKELKVSVVEKVDEDFEKFHELPVAERLKILRQFQGTAKYPDTITDKYSVYEQ